MCVTNYELFCHLQKFIVPFWSIVINQYLFLEMFNNGGKNAVFFSFIDLTSLLNINLQFLHHQIEGGGGEDVILNEICWKTVAHLRLFIYRFLKNFQTYIYIFKSILKMNITFL